MERIDLDRGKAFNWYFPQSVNSSWKIKTTLKISSVNQRGGGIMKFHNFIIRMRWKLWKKQAIWPTDRPTSRMWWDNAKINLKLWGYKIQHDMTFTMLVWRLKSIQCMTKNNVVHLVTLGFFFRILLLPLGTKTVEFCLIGLTFIKTCLNIILFFPLSGKAFRILFY